MKLRPLCSTRDDKKGIGFRYTFKKTDKTEGFLGKNDGAGSYTALPCKNGRTTDYDQNPK